MKFLICHSGGVSSAQCALTIAEHYDPSDMILLNHTLVLIFLSSLILSGPLSVTFSL